MRQERLGGALGLLVVMIGSLSQSGCKTVCMAADPIGPPVFEKVYKDDTPENLAESYLFAWGEYDDDAVYYFRTPRDQQTAVGRDAFIADGAEKCRWQPESWWMDGATYTQDGTRAVLDVSVVSSAEGYTTQQTLRFSCLREGTRWLVENHEWVGEWVPWGALPK